MNESYRLGVVLALANWGSNNKYFSRAIPMQSRIFDVSEGVITILLIKLEEQYCKKFIEGKLADYCNLLLEQLSPVLRKQVKRFEYQEYKFKVVFEYKTKLVKDIVITV